MKTELHRDSAARGRTATPRRPDVICFSHVRWGSTLQRPQHLLSRCARHRRVFFVEEPVLGSDYPTLELRLVAPGARSAVPRLPRGLDPEQTVSILRRLLAEMMRRHGVDEYVLWYFSPAALPFTRHLTPRAIVYDALAAPALLAGPPADLEAELLRRSHLVLADGASLYEARRGRHDNVHPAPSGVDVAHFARARRRLPEPEDQALIARPRLGYNGVIDGRVNLALLAELARLRPAWQLVMLGPVAGIEPGRLPSAPGIHWLGARPYEALPAYLAGWDVALLPLVVNEATHLLGPASTPEYLAAGRPVVSAPLRDVVQPYGELGLVHVAGSANDFVRVVEACLAEETGPVAGHRRAVRHARIDGFLSQTSWDGTWARIESLLAETLRERRALLGRS